MSSSEIIYIDEKDSLPKHWRSVAAEHQHGHCYRVLESSEDPEHFYRQFESGDVVRCEVNEFYEGETGLIAVSECNCAAELRLSALRALLGAIPSSLRAVSVDVDKHTIYYRCIFDDEPTEIERDLLSVAATEVIADFPEPYDIEEEYLVIPKSGKMNHLKHLVFHRYEPLDEANTGF